MLERAGTCLDTTTRHVARHTAYGIRSRRLLHSAFWHHGASDLDLPVWWATMFEPMVTAFSVSYSKDTRPPRRLRQTQHDLGILEFLYPPKSLALIKRLSKLGGDCLAISGYHANTRSYSSARKQSTLAATAPNSEDIPKIQQAIPSELDSLAQRTRNSIAAISRTPTLPSHLLGERLHIVHEQILPKFVVDQPLEKLLAYLDGTLPSPQDGDTFETVWQLFLQLTPEQRTQILQRRILNFLSFSNRQDERVRSSLLLGKIEQNMHWKSILLKLHNGEFKDAAKTHDFVTSANNRSLGYIGSDLLLAHALQRQEWVTALQIFNARMASFALQGTKLETSQSESSIWTFVERLPDLEAIVMAYIKNTDKQLRESNQQARAFLRHLVSCALMNDNMSHLNIKRMLIAKLESIGLADSGLYEVTMSTVLKRLSAGRLPLELYTKVRGYFFDIYKKYQLSLKGPPPEATLSEVLAVLNDHRGFGKLEVSIQSIEEDLRNQNRPILSKTLNRLLGLYGRSGDVASVSRCFNEFSRKAIGRRVLPTSLIAAHARRADTVEAQREFDRISTELRQKPDVGCWGALLNAYVRGDDVDGTLECYNRMLNSGLQLNRRSFAPIIQYFANRGDVGQVIEILETTKRKGVLLNADLFSNLVLAHIKSDNLPAAEEALIAIVNAKRNGDLQDSSTKAWNYILTAYATRRDVENVLRLFKEMQQNDVASDSMTYGALVHVLCLTHQTATAQKMVEKVMPEKGIPVLPFHYALLIAGYHRQDQHAKAVGMMDHMKKQGITPDASVTSAYVRAKSFQNLKDIECETASGISQQNREDEFRELLEGNDLEGSISYGPRLGLKDVDPRHPSDAYLETLLINYGNAGMSGMVRKLTDLYEANHQNGSASENSTSLRILTALMLAHFHAGDHSKVQDYWDRYAQTVARYFHFKDRKALGNQETNDEMCLNGGMPESTSHSITTWPFASLENAKIPPSRRSIFSRPLVPYIRSLSAQQKYDLIYSTIHSLLYAGFTLDNLAWNIYITHLGQSHNPAHVITAFRACEEKLMPNFPGWAEEPSQVTHQVTHRQRRAKYLRGFEYMNVKAGRGKRWLGLLMPQFKTLLVLRGVLDRIELAGQGLEGEKGFKWPHSPNWHLEGKADQENGAEPSRKLVLTTHGLGLIAPATVKATETIPVVIVPPTKFPEDARNKAKKQKTPIGFA